MKKIPYISFMDISQYLQRIRYEGSLSPTLPTLRELHKSHLLTVPFENLDIHYRTPIKLEVPRVFEKVVANHRGGFCYELNGLFYELLQALGFEVRRIAAQVYDEKKGYGPPFDHLAILTTIDGVDYLTDVGFGDFTLEPLVFTQNILQSDPKGDFMIDRTEDGYFRVNKIINGKSVPKYIFEDIPRAYHEYRNMCHYHQTHPASHFTQKPFISLATETGRVSLIGKKLKVTKGEDITEQKLPDEAAFREALWNYFKVNIPT